VRWFQNGTIPESTDYRLRFTREDWYTGDVTDNQNEATVELAIT